MSYKTLIAMTAVLTLFAQTASAAASKEENVGFGTGAIVGAAAGGPIGFFIGAGIGAILGDSFHKKSERINDLNNSLQESHASVITLERGIDELGGEVARLQTIAKPGLVSLMQAGIDMDLLFRTDEYSLTDTTGDRLAQMAASLAGMPEVRIQLDGFSDERGDAKYNYTLSQKRVEFVRNLFIAAGVHPTRINMSAHGESVAQDANLDSYALERRVSVRLFIDNAQSVASNPSW